MSGTLILTVKVVVRIVELKDRIKDLFEGLELFEKGGASYLFLIMPQMFQMTIVM
jgi:hypothetical protein